ncbi:MAG: methionine--tRNA ligase subunit beta [Candidatus Bathyarchaeota archaeon]|nr:methionine--tRNA ligase subunit beta [Candidatus Bathyarchaeota archaeon]
MTEEVKSTEEITFDYFTKLDLRVGKIIEAVAVPESKKLIKMQVDFRAEKRQCIAGLLKYYKPEELAGKKCVFLLNLQRRMIAGLESQAMILAAEDAAGNVSVLQPEKDVAEGSKIG